MTKLNLTDTETKDLRLDLLKIASGMQVDAHQAIDLAAKMEAFVVGEKERPDE